MALWLVLASASRAGEVAQEEKPRPDLTELTLEQLLNVEVTTVSRTPQKRGEVPAAVAVISQEEVRRSGATSVTEALRLAPGVQVARIDSNKWAIGVRGFASRLSRSMLALVDGRSVYTPLFAGVYWEVEDTLLEDIDRIEVIRGPGGTLWGANAVNGVINIITQSAEETQGSLVTTGGGFVEQGFAGFRYGAKAGENFYYRLYGKGFSRDAGFHRTGDDFDDWRFSQGGFRADWRRRERDSFTLQGDLYYGQTGQRTAITTLSPPAVTTVQDNATLAGGNLLGRWRRQGSETSELALQTYYDHTDRRELSFEEARDTFDLDFQHHLLVGSRHHLTWGVGYRVTSGAFAAVPSIVFLPARRTDHLVSGFVQDEIFLVKDRLRWTVGSKVERNSYSGFEAQPTTRLLWTPVPRHTLWASVSRAIRTPSRVEHDLAVTTLLNPLAPAFARVLGDKGFVSEKLLAYEAGYRVEPLPGLFLDIAAFYNDYEDLLSLEPGVPFLEPAPAPAHLVFPSVLRNRIDGKTYGAEVAVAAHPAKRWRLRGTYSYLRLNLEPETTSRDTTTAASTEGSSPRHQVSLQSFLNLPRNLELDVLFRSVDVLRRQRVPSYTTADVHLGWRPTENLEFAAVGQNLLQPRHPEFGGGSSGSTEVKRGGYAKATWRW